MNKSLKEKLKIITRKTKPMTFDERIQKLKETQTGWINYFRMASMQTKLNEIDGWVRNRLRYCIWHHWKKPERKRKNLIRLGVEISMAYQWSRSRMGGWKMIPFGHENASLSCPEPHIRNYYHTGKVMQERL